MLEVEPFPISFSFVFTFVLPNKSEFLKVKNPLYGTYVWQCLAKLILDYCIPIVIK